jgi:hypothetical protein
LVGQYAELARLVGNDKKRIKLSFTNKLKTGFSKGNVCSHSVQSLLASLSYKDIKNKIHKAN